MRKVGTVVAFWSGVSFLACGCGAELDREDTSQARQALFIGDSRAGFDEMAHPQVVSLVVPLTPSSVGCTGVVIASNAILTAAHCAQKQNSPDAELSTDPEDFTVLFGNLTEAQNATLLATVPPSPGVTAGQIKPSFVIIHSEYEKERHAAWDVMLLLLQHPIPRSVMKPLKVTHGYPPDNFFWVEYEPRFLGVGATTNDCSGPAGGPVRFLDGGHVEDANAFFTFKHMQSGSHLCPGDSGGPFLTHQAANKYHDGKNILDDEIISIESGADGDGHELGPQLQRPEIFLWLWTHALDRDGDMMDAYYDKCDMLTATTSGEPQEDKDSDGVGNACDPCPLDPDNGDEDGDAILDCLDACPEDANNPDKDGDGLIDCVDPCPKDGKLTPDDVWGDADHDGRCNSADNCPTAANPFQDNANLRSERAHNTEELGDACDPVPVPAAEPVAVIEEDPAGLKPCIDSPNCPGATADDQVFVQCGKVFYDTLSVRPLRSQHRTDRSQWQNVLGVPTSARFCQYDPKQNFKCINPMADIQDARLYDAACASGCGTPESEKIRYHRISFSSGGNKNPDDSPATLDYAADPSTPGHKILWKWSYQADFQRWLAAGQINPSLNLKSPSELVGALWLHAHTKVGADLFVPDKGFFHGDWLANRHVANVHGTYYEPDDLDELEMKGFSRTDFLYYPERSTCFTCVHLDVEYIPEVVSDAAPDAPKPNSPAPYLFWRPLDAAQPNAFRRLGAQPKEASVLVRSASGLFAAARTVESDCNGEVVHERLGTSLRKRLNDASLRWVNAAEPVATMGDEPEFPLAVALSEGPVDLIDTVVDSDGSLTSDEDRSLMRAPSINPPPGTRFAAVLSRVRRSVFLAGGEDPATGGPTGAIWLRPLNGHIWKALPTPGYAPHKVLAATYSFATDKLYILDEDVTSEARLASIDAASGAAAVLGAWPRHPGWDMQWLAVDRDGAILLASSNTATQQGVITRIDVAAPGGPQVSGRFTEQKALVMPPLVDGSGYTLVLRKVPQSADVEPRRFLALPLVAASFMDLGQQL